MHVVGRNTENQLCYYVQRTPFHGYSIVPVERDLVCLCHPSVALDPWRSDPSHDAAHLLPSPGPFPPALRACLRHTHFRTAKKLCTSDIQRPLFQRPWSAGPASAVQSICVYPRVFQQQLEFAIAFPFSHRTDKFFTSCFTSATDIKHCITSLEMHTSLKQ
jgi:hypothetical protein